MAVAEPAIGAADWRSRILELAVPATAIAVAILLGGIVILLTGADPVGAYAALAAGAIGTPASLAATLLRSLPIVVAGIGIALAFRAGAFNLGAEGQMILGALATALVAIALPGLPPPIAIPVALGAGCLAGAAWAIGPALLQVRLEIPILITTLVLNYVGNLLAAYAVTSPLRDLGGGAAVAQTAMIPEAFWLPAVMAGTRLHAGVLALVLLPLLVLWVLRRTVFGYELRMVGANPLFAEYGGVNAGRTVLVAMLFSGAICGLAGSLLVLGLNHRYVDTMITSAGFAWSGFIAAVLAMANPLWTAASGLFLGGLQVGAAGMARSTAVPLQVVDVVQAAIILVVAVRPGIRARLRRALRIS